MKKLGPIRIFYRMTDHRPRAFKNDYAMGVRFHRFCISWAF